MLLSIGLLIIALLVPMDLYLLAFYLVLLIVNFYLLMLLINGIRYAFEIGPLVWWLQHFESNAFGTCFITMIILGTLLFILWIYTLPVTNNDHNAQTEPH